MRRSVRIVLALSIGASLALVGPPAFADDVTCTGTIGSQAIDGNVRVPAGATCTLDGTRVDGNVLVGPGATLTTRGGTRIDGNIQDDDNDAGHVRVAGSWVGGNIQLEQGSSAAITDTDIDGDLQLESNDGALRADRNVIGGNLQANQNTGGLTINDNTIDGDLQCQANVPAPTGAGNIVRGDAEDQCASLTGAPTQPPPSAVFDDVAPGSTHADAIAWLVDNGITEGCTSDGRSYCPTRAVTRAQMATFLDRALDLPDGSSTFDDVSPTSVHAPSIGAILRAGITEGCTSDGRSYCPTRAVTRAQMASFLERALND
jgi:hypothetical protein